VYLILGQDKSVSWTILDFIWALLGLRLWCERFPRIVWFKEWTFRAAVFREIMAGGREAWFARQIPTSWNGECNLGEWSLAKATWGVVKFNLVRGLALVLRFNNKFSTRKNFRNLEGYATSCLIESYELSFWVCSLTVIYRFQDLSHLVRLAACDFSERVVLSKNWFSYRLPGHFWWLKYTFKLQSLIHLTRSFPRIR
jgi:hypothetical protein